MEVGYLLMNIKVVGEEVLRGKFSSRHCLVICKL